MTYSLPASAVDTEDIMEGLGAADSSKVKFNVTVTQLTDNDVTIQNGQLVIPPVAFSVTASYNGKSVEVGQFKNYVDRVITIPDGVDPSKITTAVVVDADGNEHHVPTNVFKGTDGKYYAKISSLTNSTYALIYNPVEFADMESHWAKDAVNNMGSRMILTGYGDNNFEPDKNMTRAEFAAVMVRALGLGPEACSGSFKDVSANDWYSSYIETAATYGIVTGYDDGTFGPNDRVTREQAMTMLGRAMKITGLKADAVDANTLLAAYSDGTDVSDYTAEKYSRLP